VGKYVNVFSTAVGTWMGTLFLEAKKAKFHFFLGKILSETLIVFGLCILVA
jgi:hypothetical protein